MNVIFTISYGKQSMRSCRGADHSLFYQRGIWVVSILSGWWISFIIVQQLPVIPNFISIFKDRRFRSPLSCLLSHLWTADLKKTGMYISSVIRYLYIFNWIDRKPWSTYQILTNWMYSWWCICTHVHSEMQIAIYSEGNTSILVGRVGS